MSSSLKLTPVRTPKPPRRLPPLVNPPHLSRPGLGTPSKENQQLLVNQGVQEPRTSTQTTIASPVKPLPPQFPSTGAQIPFVVKPIETPKRAVLKMKEYTFPHLEGILSIQGIPTPTQEKMTEICENFTSFPCDFPQVFKRFYFDMHHNLELPPKVSEENFGLVSLEKVKEIAREKPSSIAAMILHAIYNQFNKTNVIINMLKDFKYFPGDFPELFKEAYLEICDERDEEPSANADLMSLSDAKVLAFVYPESKTAEALLKIYQNLKKEPRLNEILLKFNHFPVDFSKIFKIYFDDACLEKGEDPREFEKVIEGIDLATAKKLAVLHPDDLVSQTLLKIYDNLQGIKRYQIIRSQQNKLLSSRRGIRQK